MHSEFDALREKLLREGVAPRNVRRYLTELREHLADLTARERAEGHDARESAIRARAALGDDDTLGRAMLARPGARSLSARAPWAVFGLLPPLVAMAAIVIAAALMFAMDWLFDTVQIHQHLAGHTTGFWYVPAPPWLHAFAAFTTAACNYGFGILIAAAFVAIALRQRMKPAWPLAGIIFVAIFANLVTVWAYYPPVPVHHSATYLRFVTGFAFTADKQHPFVLSIFLARLLLTLVPVGALYLMLRQRLRGSAPSV